MWVLQNRRISSDSPVVTGRSIREVGSCMSKGLKICWLPASLDLAWGRTNPLFLLPFSPLPSASCSRDKGEKPFLLLLSSCQLLRLERNTPRNSLFVDCGQGGGLTSSSQTTGSGQDQG